MSDAPADRAGGRAERCRVAGGMGGGRATVACGAAAGRAMRRGAGRRDGCLGNGESAGLPEQEKLLQAAENARQEGSDQGVERPGMRVLSLRCCAEAGEVVA